MVAGVFGVATLASLVTHDVTTLSIITPVMIIVAGGLMAIWHRNGRNGAH